MSLSEKYKKSLRKRWSMRFKTNHPDGDTYDGVVLLNRRNFILMREEGSFEFNGLILLPKRSICGYRDGDHEKRCNEILRRNRQIRQNTGLLSPWLKRCETIRDVVSGLCRNKIWPAVEVVEDEKEDYTFYIGPIVEPEKHDFGMWCYDAQGRWQDCYTIAYDEIFRLEFGAEFRSTLYRTSLSRCAYPQSYDGFNDESMDKCLFPRNTKNLFASVGVCASRPIIPMATRTTALCCSIGVISF